VAFAQIDLADVISRDSALASDRAHEISDFHAVACADRHEKPDHSGCGVSTTNSGALAFHGWFCTRSCCLIRFGLPALSPLTLENVEGGRGELGAVEFL
jgi:hypothetical protein